MTSAESFGPASTAGQNTQFAGVYNVLQKAVADRAFPGAAFGVLHRGRVVAMDALGSFTYEQGAPAVTPTTVFDLASVTKVVATTSVAMLLYDRGLLDLDLPLGDILPGFVIGHTPGDHKESVTLRMLLAHSSGLPAYARLFETASNPYALLRACLEIPLEAPPMTRSEYSDIGFILLGKALEVLAGESLCSFAQREIIHPLGMNATTYCPHASWCPAIPPTVDDTSFRRRVIQGEVHDEHAYILKGCSGHAGLFSNVPDVLRYAGAILAPGESPALFKPTTLDLFCTKQALPSGTSRALGWDTPSEPSSSGRYFSPRSVGHLGYTGTSLWIDRERDLAVVLLTNRTWPDRSNQAIKEVRPAFHNAVFEALSLTD